MRELTGKVAFVTGAARGQGRSHCVRLAEAGADIIAIDTTGPIPTVPYEIATSDDLAVTAHEVRGFGRRVVTASVDVRNLPELTTAVDRAVAELGGLHIVIANAGISSMARALEMDEATWQTMIDINLTGAWKTVRASAPHIVTGGRGGSIVLTSSLAAMVAYENIAHYAAAKAGLVGLMAVLAKELGPHGIRVNTVHPGVCATPMVLNESTFRLLRPELDHPTQEDFKEVAGRFHRLPTAMLDPIDVSNAILYLVSDAGRYITGTTHVIDAGARLTS
jgi:SDR family mycofactocin-dependent oxidoreductase